MNTHHKSDQSRQFKEETVTENRPWGKFVSFPHRNASSVKIITINPGQSLSLQYHKHRSEFWIILDKGLEITVGDKVWRPVKNEEISIPPRAPHRVRNTVTEAARILEFWIGDSAEEDIVRLMDNYGRK